MQVPVLYAGFRFFLSLVLCMEGFTSPHISREKSKACHLLIIRNILILCVHVVLVAYASQSNDTVHFLGKITLLHFKMPQLNHFSFLGMKRRPTIVNPMLRILIR
jgi:hypothetical protein